MIVLLSGEAVKKNVQVSIRIYYFTCDIMSCELVMRIYIRDMRRVVIRGLVTRISSRAAKRVNDKRATGINLSSFPGWWSGNFLLIVGGNRVCRPVDQTLNSSLLTLRPTTDSVTQWLYCIHQSMLHCMHLGYPPGPSCSRSRSVLHGPSFQTNFAVTIINVPFKYATVTRNHLIILFKKNIPFSGISKFTCA